MPIVQTSIHCKHCNELKLHTRSSPNHLVHALVSLFLCGIWIPIWMIVAMASSNNPFRCSSCGVVNSVYPPKQVTPVNTNQSASAIRPILSTPSNSDRWYTQDKYKALLGAGVLVVFLGCLYVIDQSSVSSPQIVYSPEQIEFVKKLNTELSHKFVRFEIKDENTLVLNQTGPDDARATLRVWALNQGSFITNQQMKDAKSVGFLFLITRYRNQKRTREVKESTLRLTDAYLSTLSYPPLSKDKDVVEATRKKTRVRVEIAPVRIDPTGDGEVITNLNKNSSLVLIYRRTIKSPWYKVRTENGKEGWIHGDHIYPFE